MIFLPDLEARKTLTSEQRSWLALRPYVWCGPDFACTHADFSAPSDWLYILKPKDAWRSLWARNEEVLFVGHTHIPFIMKQPADKVKLSHSFDEEEANNGMRGLVMLKSASCRISQGARYVVNVGSVGKPQEGHCSTYCVYDSEAKRIELVRLRL